MTTHGAGPAPVHRRGRTRWLLVTPLVFLAVVVAGVVTLEGSAPEVESVDRSVQGVAPPALSDERACTRQGEGGVAEDLRNSFPPGGSISSTQIYLCPSAFDGQEVTFVGEVVGEVLERSGGAWVQVNDDAYALEHGPLIAHRERAGFNVGVPVWLPDGLHDRIDDVGRYERRGDVILVRGTLYQADPDDGGGLTIRAEEMEVLAASIEIEDPLHVPQLIAALALALLALVGVAWSRRIARRA